MKITATHIVILPTIDAGSRKVCDKIENKTFKSVDELRDLYRPMLEGDTKIQVFSIVDFKDNVNDGTFENFHSHLISYVTIKNHE